LIETQPLMTVAETFEIVPPSDILADPAARQPVRRQVEYALRDAITAGRFQPGDHLPDRVLCEMFGASRSVVREAVRLLEAEGLITVIPNRGPFVTRLNAADARQLYEVRAALEAMAGEGFAERASDSERAALRQIFEQLAATGPGADKDTLLALKQDFYAVLLQGCRNRYAARMLEPLLNRIAQLRKTTLAHPLRLPHTIRELRRIVEAIERRDPEEAREACRDHVQRAAAVALRTLNQRERNEAVAEPA
jgi:DNA-binding GntR family transcriptional regulator